MGAFFICANMLSFNMGLLMYVKMAAKQKNKASRKP
jgi:hypothetical protein